MTNFEKWKQGLTVENCLPLAEAMCYAGCLDCPVFSSCEAALTTDCESHFRRWAESEAEE